MYKFKKNKLILNIFIVSFWLFIWQIIANSVNSDLILPTPINIIKYTIELIKDTNFINRVIFSFININIGVILSAILSVIASILSYKFNIIKLFLNPIISVVRAVPLATIIILFLVWSNSKKLSIIVSVFMAFPILYTNMLKGFYEIDENIKEMAHIFKISTLRKIIYIYFFQLFPYFESAYINALGIGWKAGIAAELIAVPANSIGESLYNSKIYLHTIELFSWAIIIVFLGFVNENIFTIFIKFIKNKIERSNL